jgi:cathepsin A (carboxypeptidase C)
MIGRLPPGVFECSGGSSVKVEESAPVEPESKKKKETFNLKEGVTLTLSSGEVDRDFCDASSPLSLAGYMNVKGSQFDTDDDKNLFYWFFEKRTTSQVPGGSSPTVEDGPTPLVIWLTGGPGCSSSLALLTENGPCSVEDDGTTTKVNPYSWTESANVLWLDQPADVGYSYGQGNDTNEEMISEDAYYFLQAFFKSQEGSKYKDSPLFIVGESYGGHYAPAIAHRIWMGNKSVQPGLLSLNLKGLAVGNGLTDPEEQYKWYAEMAYNNSHEMKVIDEKTYNMMKSAEPMCTKGIAQCNKGDGMLSSFACQAAFAYCNMALTTPYRATMLNPYDIRKPCGDNPLCYDFSHIEKFMNNDSTKKALHVDDHNPTWQTCNMLINMSFHVDWMKNFAPYVADLLNDGIPALIYAGDVDFICNYLGNRAWTLNLDWNHKTEFNAAQEHDWNNGGGLARTSNGLTFLQVYDAGHMVPSDQPVQALHMITQFLNGQAF